MSWNTSMVDTQTQSSLWNSSITCTTSLSGTPADDATISNNVLKIEVESNKSYNIVQ